MRFDFTNVATISRVLLLFIQMFLFMTSSLFVFSVNKFATLALAHLSQWGRLAPDRLMSPPTESISESPNNFLRRSD